MGKVIVHRGTGTIFDVEDDVWVIDSDFVDEETGEIDDDELRTYGVPLTNESYT